MLGSCGYDVCDSLRGPEVLIPASVCFSFLFFSFTAPDLENRGGGVLA